MRDHARRDSYLIFKERKLMDMKPLALMLVLTALAVSEPARLFEAVMNIMVNVLKLVVH